MYLFLKIVFIVHGVLRLTFETYVSLRYWPELSNRDENNIYGTSVFLLFEVFRASRRERCIDKKNKVKKTIDVWQYQAICRST